MDLELECLQVGPWPMNCYLLRCPVTEQVAIIDPGADADTILAAVGHAPVRFILLTHAHRDHVGALDSVRLATNARVGIHPADAEAFGLEGDMSLHDGMHIEVGHERLTVVYVPGHTPGSVCLRLDGKALVGDAIFPGGPGYTATPEALELSLASLAQTLFQWPGETELHPGHGGSTTVGAERASFEQFLASDRPPDLCGHVMWR